MLKLRPFKEQDAKDILSWIKDEEALRKWSLDVYESYPVKPKDMLNLYKSMESTGKFFPMTAFDEFGIVGHITLRFIDDNKQILRFGFVIVDDKKRGEGYGKELLRLAIDYSYRFFGTKKITLGVLENNPSALFCYKAAGFKESKTDSEKYYSVLGQNRKCIELEYER
ncbi:MAG: GNAT family N-acetyltransferase [Lachnospiraceae bacterium]|nr:GNAT family N-acetyltransferase [Lachnospiraceae bacterium]